MHDSLDVPKWLPFHLLLSQFGLSSSMSHGTLSKDVFPVMVFPVAPSAIDKPEPPPLALLLWFVVLAYIWFFEPENTKIPPKLSLAVLATMVLLLPTMAIESLTLLPTRALLSATSTIP